MNNKILLIRPPNIYGLKNYPPFGLIALGSVLEGAGYSVKIMNQDSNDSKFENELIRQAEEALFIGITATTAEISNAVRLARQLREASKRRVPLVWGGCHTTLFPDQMEKSELVDYAIIGEGEKGVLQVADFLLRRNSQVNGKIIRNNFIDLNELTLPRYDLEKNIETFITRPLTDKFQEYYQKELRWLPYESSRGCPFKCAFCINTVVGNQKYRVKDPKKVAGELAELVTKYRLNHVKIIDDLFFVQIERVRKIFEEASGLGIKYTWDAECRPDFFHNDFIDDRLLEFLKENGLVQLTFGIESGSLSTLERMRKGRNMSPESAIKAVELCAKHNIAVRGSFVLDIPGDTPRDIMETVNLIRKLRKFPRFACGVHTYRPYPRSPLCEQLIQEGKIYQPPTLDGWTSEASIRQYTDTSVVRKWQSNWKLSSKVSFYECVESGFWLKPHQLKNPIIRLINKFFILLARFRNKFHFYGFSVDKVLYIWFKDFCIRIFS